MDCIVVEDFDKLSGEVTQKQKLWKIKDYNEKPVIISGFKIMDFIFLKKILKSLKVL